MELVDSSKQMLNTSKLMVGAMSGKSFSKDMASVVSAAKEGTDLIQVNNTAFATRRGKGKDANLFFAILYNMDIVENLPKNISIYFRNLQTKGATFGAIDYYNDMYTQPFIDVYEKNKKSGLKITIGKTKTQDRIYRAFISFPTEEEK